MNHLFLSAALLLTTSVLPLPAAPQAALPSATSASIATILTATDAGKLLPPAVFFHGQSASVQARNSGGVRLTKDSYMLVTLVDNSGYSTGIREKYQAYLLNEVTLEIGGQTLKPGAYGFGFQEGGKFLIMDIGANDVLNATSQRDAELKRPVPMQMLTTSTAGSYRLYAGRDFVEFHRAH